jgi:flagellar biogenesis protein FliO
MSVKEIGGVAGWLATRFEKRTRRQPRLAVLDRLTVAPRQSLMLVEADGQRILVATSAEGAPAFYPLDAAGRFDVKIPVLGRTPVATGKMRW